MLFSLSLSAETCLLCNVCFFSFAQEILRYCWQHTFTQIHITGKRSVASIVLRVFFFVFFLVLLWLITSWHGLWLSGWCFRLWDEVLCDMLSFDLKWCAAKCWKFRLFFFFFLVTNPWLTFFRLVWRAPWCSWCCMFRYVLQQILEMTQLLHKFNQLLLSFIHVKLYTLSST